MSLLYQIPRQALWWMLGAQAIVILPHLAHLPLWLVVVWAGSALWRLQISRGAWGIPGKLVKGVLTLASVVGLFLSFGRFFGLEPLVSLLVLAFALKLLELNQQRDMLTLLMLGFFVAATQLLFSTSIFAFLITLLGCWSLVGALRALQSGARPSGAKENFLGSGKIIFQAIPLTLLLFVVMPRIGSLWAVPMAKSTGKTGFSDFMAPGNISNLNKDFSPALRVTFVNNQPPQNSELYWRGMSLSQFDGRVWRLGNVSSKYLPWARGRVSLPWVDRLQRYSLQNQGRGVAYQVMMEPTGQPWMFSLKTALNIEKDIYTAVDYSLMSKRNVGQRRVYDLVSYPEFKRYPQRLSPVALRANTRLPRNVNPKTHALAEQWASQYTVNEVIQRLLALYTEQFHYSLENLELLGADSVDDFLFGSKRGYCEHFSSSFVFFLRAAGIPARVVTGYQGGQWNASENYLLVTQADAHAWAEVWLEGQGWVRFDPTAAVAPERIELGFREYLEGLRGETESSVLNQYRQSQWLNQLQLQMDAMNYSWQRWVIGYDQDSQFKLFNNILGGNDYWRVASFFMGGAGTILGLLGLVFWWRGRPKPQAKEIQFLLLLEAQLAKKGESRNFGETPKQFVQRAGKNHPNLAPYMDKFIMLHYELMYQNTQDSNRKTQLYKQLKRLLQNIRTA